MEIVKVESKKSIKDFHNTGRIIYKNDVNWTCPLDIEIESIFNPSLNKSFNYGKAERWVLYEHSSPIGRIASFYDSRKSNNWDQPTGGIGFFECIDNQEAATLLFDTSKEWLEKNGLQAMDGPINFGENFNHWGLLVDGFMPQAYGMQYHKPYYKGLFEDYGFKVFFNQLTHHLDLKDVTPRFWDIAKRAEGNPRITVEHFTYKNAKKYIEDLVEIYNETWSSFKDDSTRLTFEDINSMLSDAKGIIDEDLVWFVYKDNEPAGFYVMFPDINQIIGRFNGKLNLLNKIRLLYLKRRNTITRTRGFVMGMKPKFQRLGLESIMFYQFKKVFEKKPNYKEIDLSWVGDYNPRMRRLYKNSGAKYAKTHTTYRYLFDQTKEFTRFPIPESKLSERK